MEVDQARLGATLLVSISAAYQAMGLKAAKAKAPVMMHCLTTDLLF